VPSENLVYPLLLMTPLTTTAPQYEEIGPSPAKEGREHLCINRRLQQPQVYSQTSKE
jgi:hypothetical protein